MGFTGLWKLLNELFPDAFITALGRERFEVMINEIMAALYTASAGAAPQAEKKMSLSPSKPMTLHVNLDGSNPLPETSWEDSAEERAYSCPEDIAKHAFDRPMSRRFGAGHIFYVGDDATIKLTVKEYTREKRKESQLRYNPPYEEEITRFTNKFVMGPNDVPYPNFKLESRRIMSNHKHRQLLFNFFYRWAKERRWEEPINLFVDLQGCPHLVVDRHPTERANLFPFGRRMHTEADQEIPRLIRKIVKETKFRKFLVWSVDSDVMIILLAIFFDMLVNDEIRIVQMRDETRMVDLNILAKCIAQEKLNIGLFVAICIVACDTDFTSKSHYTHLIGASKIMSLDWIRVIASWFGNQFNFEMKQDLEALIHVILHLNARDGNVRDVFIIPKYVSLVMTYQQLMDIRKDSVKSKKGQSTAPLWMKIAQNPELLYTPRSELDAMKPKKHKAHAEPPEVEHKIEYVSGDADVGAPVKKAAVIRDEPAWLGVLSSSSAAVPGNDGVSLIDGQKTLNAFGFTAPKDKVYAQVKTHDPTPFQSFRNMCDMVLKGVVPYWIK